MVIRQLFSFFGGGIPIQRSRKDNTRMLNRPSSFSHTLLLDSLFIANMYVNSFIEVVQMCMLTRMTQVTKTVYNLS
jgi:hypothetical protein